MIVRPNKTPAFGIEQLLLDGVRNPYYSESGREHLLKDYSFAGDFREKRLGHCLDFNGVDQAVVGPRLHTSNNTHLFVCGWVKVAAAGALDQIIASDSTAGSDRGWSLRVASGGFWEWFSSPDGNTTNYHRVSGGTVIADGAWYHVAAYFNAGVLQLWVDGSLETLNDSGLGSPAGEVYGTTQQLTLAAANASSLTNFIDARMHDVRVYSGANAIEAAANIANIYNFSYLGSPTAHYWLQEESGSTVYDSSGNGNHATISNYVSSMRVTDSGVKYSVNNENGYSQWWSNPSYTPNLFLSSQYSNSYAIRAKFKFVYTNITNSRYIFALSPDHRGLGLYLNSNTNSLRFAGKHTVIIGTPIIVDITPNKVYEIEIEMVGTGDDGYISLKLDGVSQGTSTYYIDSATSGIYANGDIGILCLGNSNEPTLNGYIKDIYIDEGNTGTWDYYFPMSYTDPMGDTGVPLTIVGTLNTTLFPCDDNSKTSDILNGQLTYKGRCPMYGLAKHVAWQTNGTDSYIETDYSWTTLVSGTQWTFEYVTTGTGYTTGIADSLNHAITVNTEVRVRLASATTVTTTSLNIDPNIPTKVTVQRDGSDIYVSANGKTELINPVIGSVPGGNVLIGRSFSTYSNISLAYLKITIGGITTTYVPIEGTRNVAKITSDNSDTKIIYNAVNGGTLSTLYSAGDGSWRLPHLENGARWASQNLFKYSEDFSNNAWVKYDGADPPLLDLTFGIQDPFGGTGAYSANLIGASSNSYSNHIKQSISIASGVTYTLSLYAKAKSIGDVGQQLWTRTPDQQYLSLGALTTEFQRLSATFTATQSLTGSLYFGGQESGASSLPCNMIFFGAQLNEGPVALPYNKTEANPWLASSLISCDPSGTSPDGNALNIPVGRLDRYDAITIDRTGGVISPLDYELGLDQLTGEAGDTFTEGIRGV